MEQLLSTGRHLQQQKARQHSGSLCWTTRITHASVATGAYSERRNTARKTLMIKNYRKSGVGGTSAAHVRAPPRFASFGHYARRRVSSRAAVCNRRRRFFLSCGTRRYARDSRSFQKTGRSLVCSAPSPRGARVPRRRTGPGSDPSPIGTRAPVATWGGRRAPAPIRVVNPHRS